ncbi:hypothetical protein Tco_0725434 [Tanacetum coccineum]|uniref:Uncharacterized protein n=1 Tax=Tanacetum coccineum TaxID=301880 RepID=A0ABQ4YD28_9ASTR
MPNAPHFKRVVSASPPLFQDLPFLLKEQHWRMAFSVTPTSSARSLRLVYSDPTRLPHPRGALLQASVRYCKYTPTLRPLEVTSTVGLSVWGYVQTPTSLWKGSDRRFPQQRPLTPPRSRRIAEVSHFRSFLSGLPKVGEIHLSPSIFLYSSFRRSVTLGIPSGSASFPLASTKARLIIGLGSVEVEVRSANGMFPGVVAANTVVVTGVLSLVLMLDIWGGVEKPGGGVISLPLVMPEK